MRDQKKIIEEIKEHTGLRVKIHEPGLSIYPSEDGSTVIYTTELARLIAIAQKYKLGHYIDFAKGYIRLYF